MQIALLSSYPTHTHVHSLEVFSVQIRCFNHKSIMVEQEVLHSNYTELLLHSNYQLKEERSPTCLSPLSPGSGWDACQNQSQQQQVAFQVWHVWGPAAWGWPQARCFNTELRLGTLLRWKGLFCGSQKSPPKVGILSHPWKKGPPRPVNQESGLSRQPRLGAFAPEASSEK